MSFSSALQEIESHNFAARLGVANTDNMLQALAAQENCVKELVSLIRDPSEASKLVAHGSSLIREQDDVRYRNPRDTAIAVYIWALAQTHPLLGRLLAAEATRAARLWWARKISLSILEGHPIAAEPDTGTDRVLLRGEWQNESGEERAALIVRDQGGDLVRNGRVLDASVIGHESDTPSSTAEIGPVGAVTNQASEADVVKAELVGI